MKTANLQEPTQEELDREAKELESDLNSLDELDSLLLESVGLAAKRKSANAKSGKHESDLIPFAPIEGDCWRTECTCAFFIRTECTCGSVHHHFSHYASFQRFTGRCSGKPTRWVRVELKPQYLSRPSIFKKDVPICPDCYGLDGAREFDVEPIGVQLELYNRN